MAAINITTANAIAELKNLITEVEALKKSTSTVNAASAASFAALEDGLKKLQANAQLTANKFNYLEAILKKQSATNTQLTSEIANLNARLNQTTTSANKAGTAITNTGTSATKTKGIFSSLAGTAGDLLKAFGLVAGVQMFVSILKGAYDTIKTFDSLSLVMEKVSKTASDLRENQRFLIDITRDYGVELVSTTTRYLKFLAAAEQSNISLKDTQNIFRSLTKAGAVLGLQTDELSSIYLALEQMLSKGKVTTEELRRQLGERLPGAMGIMAASMGVSIAKLDEMMKKGQVMSAEVLPGFAEAVEIAFGIETLDKIDTLIAAENRLGNTWKQFVKDISDGNGVIAEALKFSFNLLEKWLMGIQLIFNYTNYTKRENLLDYAKFLEYQLEEEAKVRTAAASGMADEEERLTKDKEAKLLAISNATSKEGVDQAEENYGKSIKALQDYYKRVEAERTSFAKEEFKAITEERQRLEKAIIDNSAKLKNMQDNDTETNIYGGAVKDYRGITDTTALLEKQRVALEKITVKYDIYKKQITESLITVPIKKDDEGGRKKQMIDLKEILDLSDDIKKKIIENSIELNNRLLESDESTFEDRKKLILRNQELQKQVADLDFNIDTAKNKKAYDEAIAYLDKHLKDKTLLQVDYDSQKTKLQKELAQKEELADLKRYKTNNKNAEEAGKGMIALLKEFNDEKIELVEQPFNKEITALKNAYVASKKTKKDQEDLEWGLADVAMRATNAKIDALIVYAKAERDVVNQSTENVAKWQAEIDKLEASKLVPKPPRDAAEDLRKFWTEILDMAAQANQAIGDLVDAGFERRLEMIDAEIDAEEKKYDKLMQMAGDDAALKESLQVERDASLALLDKKRLQEEQKQAKARKVFALADIAISTAQAIMSIWAQVPKFDFGISAGVMTGFVAALGAIQLATVLAAPIPQYKDGIDNVKSSHIGMVNDGKDQEYITRGNKILTTKTRNALIQLQPGDTVHKSFDALSKSSNLMSLAYNGADISKSEFDLLFYGIESSIVKGFKEAKINNNVRLNMRSNDDSYKKSWSKWS